QARYLILKTENELSVVGDASDKIGVAYFLIGRWQPSSDLSFFTTSRSTPHPLRVLAGLSPRQHDSRYLTSSPIAFQPFPNLKFGQIRYHNVDKNCLRLLKEQPNPPSAPLATYIAVQ
ncbi:hypothetical protein, partial [Microcoleus sp. MON2_D5]|uniref:hypothetical protein n=1 Tax=Microcoleus sp. MON2_D5 TaxID=2818833 RepID=UPI002FCFCFF0